MLLLRLLLLASAEDALSDTANDGNAAEHVTNATQEAIAIAAAAENAAHHKPPSMLNSPARGLFC